MSLFFRVETADGVGPYQGTGLINALVTKGVIAWSDMDETYLLDHPTPENDPVLRFTWQILKHKEQYIFGFKSLKAVYNWFCLKEEVEWLIENNFHVSIYESDYCFHGKWQSIMLSGTGVKKGELRVQ